MQAEEKILRFLIPFALLLCGVFVKRLSRNKGQIGSAAERNRRRKDWFLGVDLCFSALNSSLIMALDSLVALQAALRNPGITDEQKAALAHTAFRGIVIIVASFLGLAWTARIRANYIESDHEPGTQELYLGYYSNAVGLFCVACYLLYVKQ
jgi:hypothetical protein